MRSARLVLLLVAALFVAAEPVVHTHPLIAEPGSAGSITSPNVCGICAVGTQRIVIVHVATAPPLVAVERVVSVLIAADSVDVCLPRSARAPPSA
jgi:hypothetical protein